MTERTIVKSIDIHPYQSSAFVVSGSHGDINRIPPISKSLDIERLPAIKVGDIIKCDGNPYLSREGASKSNSCILDSYLPNGRVNTNPKSKYRVVQIGEEAWAVRRKYETNPCLDI